MPIKNEHLRAFAEKHAGLIKEIPDTDKEVWQIIFLAAFNADQLADLKPYLSKTEYQQRAQLAEDAKKLQADPELTALFPIIEVAFNRAKR